MNAACCLLAQQRSVAGPAVWFGHRVIIVFDESQDAVLQVVERTERAVTCQLLSQRSEPNLDLIEPTAMLRCVDETNPMTLVGEKISP